MIENKESSYTVKGFFVRTTFFTEKSLLRYFNQLVCFNQNSASKSGNNGMLVALLKSRGKNLSVFTPIRNFRGIRLCGFCVCIFEQITS